MDKQDPREQLFDKLNAEHKAFIDELRGKPADEIINASYKKVVYDEIVGAFENGDYTDRDYAAFNEQTNQIDALYFEWLDSDTADFEELRTVIDSYMERYEGYKVEHYRDDDTELRDDLPDRDEPGEAPTKPQPAPGKPKSAFELGMERSRAKVAEYKAQKAAEPQKTNKNKEGNEL
jgi:hypothetical protein